MNNQQGGQKRKVVLIYPFTFMRELLKSIINKEKSFNLLRTYKSLQFLNHPTVYQNAQVIIRPFLFPNHIPKIYQHFLILHPNVMDIAISENGGTIQTRLAHKTRIVPVQSLNALITLMKQAA